MDFKEILKQIKESLEQEFGDKWEGFKGAARKDIDQFLKDSKDKLERWTRLLASGAIDLEDFAWLVESQKDLMLMHALHSAGVHKISLGHLRNRVVKIIIDVVKTAVL